MLLLMRMENYNCSLENFLIPSKSYRFWNFPIVSVDGECEYSDFHFYFLLPIIIGHHLLIMMISKYDINITNVLVKNTLNNEYEVIIPSNGI